MPAAEHDRPARDPPGQLAGGDHRAGERHAADEQVEDVASVVGPAPGRAAADPSWSIASASAISAAAPPPTALNTLTSCGIAVIATRRAVTAPATAADGRAEHEHDERGRRAGPVVGQHHDGGQDRQRHPGRRDPVAAPGGGRRVHQVQAEHEADARPAGRPGGWWCRRPLTCAPSAAAGP